MGMINGMVTEAERPAPSIWQPLRNGVFRALWWAVLGSQIGTWMQTVGAQWLLVGEPNAATLVSLVQTGLLRYANARHGDPRWGVVRSLWRAR
jgi:hypothetical protein